MLMGPFVQAGDVLLEYIVCSNQKGKGNQAGGFGNLLAGAQGIAGVAVEFPAYNGGPLADSHRQNAQA